MICLLGLETGFLLNMLYPFCEYEETHQSICKFSMIKLYHFQNGFKNHVFDIVKSWNRHRKCFDFHTKCFKIFFSTKKRQKKFQKILFKFKNIKDTEAGCLVGIIDSLFPLTLFHTLEFKLAKLKSKSIAVFFVKSFVVFLIIFLRLFFFLS